MNIEQMLQKGDSQPGYDMWYKLSPFSTCHSIGYWAAGNFETFKYEKYIFKIIATFPRGQWVNALPPMTHWYISDLHYFLYLFC